MKVHTTAIDAYARTALTATSPARAVEPAATQVNSNGSEAAHVTVSDEARALAAKSAASQGNTKVAALKKQITEGEYRVNPQILALRLLDSLG